MKNESLMTTPDACALAAGPGAGVVLRLRHLPQAITLVDVHGPLDHGATSELTALVDEQLAVSPGALIVDLTEMTTLDHTAVQKLQVQAERAGEADIGFYFVATPGLVNRHFAPTGATELLDISRTLDASLRAARCRLSTSNGDLAQL